MGRILGIDFGLKRIGLAISDEEKKHAFGRPTLTVNSWTNTLTSINKICQSESVEKIVIGWPKPLSGQLKINEDLKKFAEEINKTTNRPVIYEDERLSSGLADRWLKESAGQKKEKGRRDQLSAIIILQGYLDRESKYGHQ